jgi:hypothetical protein
MFLAIVRIRTGSVLILRAGAGSGALIWKLKALKLVAIIFQPVFSGLA